MHCAIRVFCHILPIFVKLDVEPQAKQNLILIVIQFYVYVARNSSNGGRNTFCNAPRGAHEDVSSLYFPEMAWMMRILWLCRHRPGALEESARSVPPISAWVLSTHSFTFILTQILMLDERFYNRPSQHDVQCIYQCSSLFQERNMK